MSLFLILCSVIPRLFVLVKYWTTSAWQWSDSALPYPIHGHLWEYTLLSDNLFRYHTYARWIPGIPETLRPPGYPIILWPFLNHLFLLSLFQTIIGLMTIDLVWLWIANRQGFKVANFIALFVALDWASICHCPQIQAETLEAFCMTAIWMLMNYPRLEDGEIAFVGSLWTIPIFLKPITLYMPLALVWRWRHSKKAMALWLVAAYFLPICWMARNYHAVGKWEFSGIPEHHLAYNVVPALKSFESKTPIHETFNVELSEKDAMHFIYRHPLQMGEQLATGSAKFALLTGAEWILDFLDIDRTQQFADYQKNQTAKFNGAGTAAICRRWPWMIPFYAFFTILQVALYALFVMGMINLWVSGKKELFFLILTPVFMLVLLTIPGTPMARHHIALWPFLCFGAAFYRKNA